MSLSGPAVRLPDERLSLLGDLVRKSADTITAAYGGNR
jgi:IclR family acetate operon transcriptional repressor